MKKPKLYFTRGELDRDKDGQPPKGKYCRRGGRDTARSTA